MAGWEQTHRRYRLVYAVADDIVRRGPAARDVWQGAIEAEYGSTADFLYDVLRRWRNALDAHSDEVGTRRLEEIEAAVSRANAPLRALLDAFAAHPVLAARRGTRAVQPA